MVPKNQGFPTKNDQFGVFWGYTTALGNPLQKMQKVFKKVC